MSTREDYLLMHRVSRQKHRQILYVLTIFSLVVVLAVFWWLKLTGITMTGDALCETEEHLHSASCYEYTLICTDESEDHEHTSECTEKNLFCEISEHTHTSECYSTEEDITAGEEFMAMFGSTRATLEYTSHLEGEVVGAVITDKDGNVIGEDGVVYIGEHYSVALEFQEINKGDKWYQFKADEDGYLTYHIPDNLQCTEFDSWHSITATGDDGTVANVGEYYVDANGLLKVKFYKDSDGVLFFDKYTNTDFSVEFDATVAGTSSGSSTEIDFGEEIKINVTVDGNAEMNVSKTRGYYDKENQQLEFEIRAEVTKGAVNNLVINDSIWGEQYVIMDTVVVKDLEGNVLDPQPNLRSPDNPGELGQYGFSMDGFDTMSAGEGVIITYRTQLFDYVPSLETVNLWNGIYFTGTNGNNESKTWSGSHWEKMEFSKMEKGGAQSVVQDENGDYIPAIQWEVEIKNSLSNMNGTIVIDTLGNGLAYYTGEEIRVKRYDANGNRMSPDAYISWDDVTVEGNRMSFALPEGYAFDVIYYTTYETLDEGETKNYENSVQTTINGVVEGTTGSADVIGITPRVEKTAWGDDGEYVNFNVSVDASAVLKDRGYFYLTDLAAFWGYNNDAGHLYVENLPENMVVTATMENGEVITYTPYVEGGPTENTYILVAPAPEGNSTLYHTFKVFFNTATASEESSKWISDMNGTIDITYKIPFTARTGTDWYTIDGDKTLGDVLLEDYRMANEAYFNYTREISITAPAYYGYNPPITKKADVQDNGVINYTVVYNNTIPGSDNQGYLNSTVDNAYFIDTFDEKLEYVPGSLMVTGYSPWQTNLWLAKYKHNGSIEGNTINVSARDLLMYDYNEEADAYGWNGLSGTATFRNYYRWVNKGGKMIFTYQLKVKEEYLNTVDFSHYVVDNTAEVTWDNGGTSGPVTESTEVDTGLLNKTLEQQDDKLIFEVVVNEYGRDLLSGKDTLTVVDSMSENLSLYWDTIKLKYKNANGELVAFDSADSEYTYTVTYDATNNSLSFEIPDSLPVVIDYTCLVTESGTVSIRNAVKVDGKANVSDIIDAEFVVTNHTGGASGTLHSFTLIKQDGTTNARLPNAEFALYARVDPEITAPAGVDRTITLSSGQTMYYIASYTTGEDGTRKIENQYLTDGGPYALVEITAPEGYELLDKPVEFYFFEEDPDGVTQTVTTLLAVENFNVGYVLPETGSVGTLPFTICGLCLMAFPLLYRIQKRRKERRAKL